MVGKLIIIYFGKGSNKGGRQYFFTKKSILNGQKMSGHSK